MQRLYSPSTGCTYFEGFHSAIPGDARPISEQHFLEVIAKPTPGMERTHDASGLPVLVAPSPPDPAAILAQTFEQQVTAINAACEGAITGGFYSTALGAQHFYSSQLDDQLNLTGAILRGLDMPYACRDEQGAKAFRLHTAAQLSQVGDDFTLYKLQLLQRANELKQQLDLALAAGDAEGMQAITWEGAES